MLAALNVGAVLLGVATAGLVASVLGLGLGALLTLIEVEGGADIGLVTGVLAGLAGGGWMAGLKARHSERFHGAVSGLLVSFIVMVVARIGGSPASGLTIAWLALVAMVVSGFFGWLAGRRKRATH